MVSIITPIYNAAKYLPALAKAIDAQTYKEYEWILIDDGSTDNSFSISQQLALKNNRIICIHQENQGVSMARNIGLNKAHGEWICFLDADDTIRPEWLQNYIIAIEKDVDIIFQGAILRDIYSEKNFRLPNIVYKSTNISKLISYWQNEQSHIGSAWSKMIKKEILEKSNIRYDHSINNFEDWVFLTECLAVCQGVKTISPQGYIYNHQNSILTGIARKNYDAKTYFSIFHARYKAAQKLKSTNIHGYEILLGKITLVLLQGIKEVYRSHSHSKAQRISILKKYRNYDISLYKLNIKDKLIYHLLTVRNASLADFLFSILFKKHLQINIYDKYLRYNIF